MAENKVNKWENLNYQSSQLEEEDLQKLEANSVPINMHQKTDPLVFEEVYSVAREAKNKLWSSHHEPGWTKRNSVKIFHRGETNKKTDLTPSALTGIRAAIHRTITGNLFQGR